MNMRIPVYQMTLSQNSEGKEGLIFSSEEKETSSQAVVFAIPVAEQHHPFHFIELLEMQGVYFPFEIDGKYYELEAKVNFPDFSFSIPETDIQVAFQADIDQYWPGYFYPSSRRWQGIHKYVGAESKLIVKNHGFMALLPVDLYEMDELYLTRKGVFVGLTPQFGLKENLATE